MNFFYKFILFLFNIFHVIFPTKVIGVRKFKKKRLIITCLHKSGWDPFVVVGKIRPEFHFCYKAELNKSKILKTMFKWAQAIPMNRGEADLAGTRLCLKYLNQDEMLFLFPEGTRNTTGKQILPFKDGTSLLAIRSKSNIVPIVMYRKPRPFRRNYLLIGEEIDTSPFYNEPFSKENMLKLTQLQEQTSLKLLNELNDYVKSKKKSKPKKVKTLQ